MLQYVEIGGGLDESIDSRVREAISELQMYLSDALAPLVVMDSIELLLQYPAEVLAAGIHEWTVTQSRREGGSVPVSDYLYHPLRKLFLIGDFRLMSKDELTKKVEELKPILLEICPPGDRELLQANCARIDEIQTGLGRTGKMWSHEHDGIVPDALLTGKGLSGGIYCGSALARDCRPQAASHSKRPPTITAQVCCNHPAANCLNT